MVQFARKCILDDENIDDYTNLEYITKILQYFHIDAWLITRSNILLSSNDSLPLEKEHFVVFCFEGTSVLYVDTMSKTVTYFNHENIISVCVPKLVERFVNRTYPEYDIKSVVSKSTNIAVLSWVMTSWFVAIVSKHSKVNVEGMQLQQLLDKEYEDTNFLASFHHMCWELVSATRIKHVHTKYSMNKASLFAVLHILHQVVKCYCKTMIDDDKVRKAKYSFDTHQDKCINMSKALSYDKLLTCWDRLSKWSSLHNGDVTYIKNANIEMSNLVLVHYRYLIECVNQENQDMVDEYKNKINTIMDLRDNVDDLIKRTL